MTTFAVRSFISPEECAWGFNRRRWYFVHDFKLLAMVGKDRYNCYCLRWLRSLWTDLFEIKVFNISLCWRRGGQTAKTDCLTHFVRCMRHRVPYTTMGLIIKAINNWCQSISKINWLWIQLDHILRDMVCIHMYHVLRHRLGCRANCLWFWGALYALLSESIFSLGN